MASDSETVVRIRLTPAQVRETLDLVDRTAEAVGDSDKRKHTRWRFRLAEPMRMACVRGGGHVIYEITPRGLSVRGLAMLARGGAPWVDLRRALCEVEKLTGRTG